MVINATQIKSGIKYRKSGEKYMKTKFNLDDDLPLKETLKLCNMVTVVRSAFHEDNKYYLYVLFIWMSV